MYAYPGVAYPGVAYPGVWDNRSTLNTKTGYDDDDSRDPTYEQQQIKYYLMHLILNFSVPSLLSHAICSCNFWSCTFSWPSKLTGDQDTDLDNLVQYTTSVVSL